MNPSKAKGTKHETAMVALLRAYGFTAERMPAGAVSHDITAAGGLNGVAIECKHAKTWQLPKWASKATAEHGNQWCILAKPGDARTTPYGTLAVLPVELLLELINP